MKVRDLEITHPWWYFAKLQKMLIFYYHDLEGATCVASICIVFIWERPSNVALKVMTRFLPSLDLVKSVSWERGSNAVKRDAKGNSWLLRAKDCSISCLVDTTESCVNPWKTPCCSEKVHTEHSMQHTPIAIVYTNPLQRTNNNVGFMQCISNKS